jgi:ABC-type antimicrobial peptide transport system permease subunit
VHDPDVPFETWYVPYAQAAATAAGEQVYVMVRAAHGDPIALTAPVERAILESDRMLVPYAPVAMDRYHADSIGRERTSAAMMTGLGVFGLLLAALGVYGVMAFSVSQRVAEIGIRMALGATPADIVPLIARRALVLVGAGVCAGAAAAAALNRVLASLLTEVGRLDTAVLTIAIALIVTVAAAACLVPSVAASRLDPIAALKRE